MIRSLKILLHIILIMFIVINCLSLESMIYADTDSLLDVAGDTLEAGDEFISDGSTTILKYPRLFKVFKAIYDFIYTIAVIPVISLQLLLLPILP